ncbi:MAG TPA: GNVR domain-containing protein [Verrucomicrobiota bacterium]|nr:GNVR domain-containing protein [Verrucomicrobiota bacterium]
MKESEMTRRLTVTRDCESTTSQAGEAISPFEMAALLVRKKRLIGLITCGAMLLAGATSLLIPNKYVSTASILPSGGIDKMADLKSLAGLSGMITPADDGSELYPVILASHTIRDAVLAPEYEYEDDGEVRQTTLAAYLDETDPDRLRAALGDITTVRLDKKTGVIDLGVETRSPALSQAVLRRYLAELESFNLHKRRTQAGERAEYLARELAERQGGLAAAEDSLAAFQSANRDWMTAGDPEVALILGRLQREVETRTQACLYLLQEYEIAKLDARKDVPVVRILDQPSRPTRESSPPRALIVIVSGLLAFLGAAGTVVGIEGLRRTRGGHRAALQTLRTDLTREFPRANRFVGRVSHAVAGRWARREAGEKTPVAG